MLIPLPPSTTDPFAMPGSLASALCLHGYTGTPYELRPLAAALSDAGIACIGPLLRGHGRDPAALRSVTAEDWQRQVRAAFSQLSPERPRFLIGSSMGCLLALACAVERPNDVDGLVLLAPALVPYPMGRVALALAHGGLGRVMRAIPKAAPGGDVVDPEARRANPTYPELPVFGMGELEELRRKVVTQLPLVRAPILVVHGTLDRTMSPASARLIASQVTSKRIERYELPRSGHLLALDVERAALVALVTRFLRERLEERSA
ncbi:MAG: alpha/beta hydrolase [Myxococcota bacterium]